LFNLGDDPLERNDLAAKDPAGVEELNQTVRVSSSGRISLPYLGRVNVSGMTAVKELYDNT